jgi:hypothetical protein
MNLFYIQASLHVVPILTLYRVHIYLALVSTFFPAFSPLSDSPIRRALLASPSLGPLVASAEDGWAWALRSMSGAKPVGMCPHLTLFKHAEMFCPVRIVTPNAPVAAEAAAAPSSAAASTR